MADKAIEVANLCNAGVKGYNEMNGRVYDIDGISTTIRANSGGHNEVKIAIPQATKQGFIEVELGGVVDMSYPNSDTRRGRVQEGGSVSPTITAQSNGLCRIEPASEEIKPIDNLVPELHIRVRKLTPRECWRLMGFSDEDFDKAAEQNSNTQLYKQAGNSIVVDVLMAIFKEML